MFTGMVNGILFLSHIARREMAQIYVKFCGGVLLFFKVYISLDLLIPIIFLCFMSLMIVIVYSEFCNNPNYCIKAVSHVINSRALTGQKLCINKAIHALLMHGYATFNMIVPGPQICCCYKMCTARL